MARRLAAVLLAAVVLALPASGRAADRTTLWFHSDGASGAIDQTLADRGAARAPWMDAAPPTGDRPKVWGTTTGPLGLADLVASWTGDVRGWVSGAEVTFWAQDARGAGTFEVLLYAGTGPDEVGRAISGPAGASPTELTVAFPGVEFPAAELRVRFVPRSRGPAILYDSPDAPSRISFDLGPIPDLGTQPRIDATYGLAQTQPDGTCAAGDALCERMMALRGDSQVVIALVDTGVNPYHVTFRREGMDVHPSTYVNGYPADAPALVLSHGAPRYGLARGTDDAGVWSQVQPNTLYWVPGSNIVGAISVRDLGDGGWAPRPVIDDSGHGTGVASVSGGGARARGGVYGSNPEALIVVVEGFGDASVQWVQSQPWIDFVSGSYGDPYALPVGGINGGNEHRYTRPFVLEDHRTACFSGGNGLSKTGLPPDRWSSIRPTSGPSWVVTVGAASPRNGQDYWWHSLPVDVISYGNHWPAADPFSIDGEMVFSGTSNASPLTCGVLSAALLAARRALGDTAEGIHAGGPASGVPYPSPALVDGLLTRIELQDAVFKTAEPVPFDPSTLGSDPGVWPTTPASWAYQGYGLVNAASGLRAAEVLLGLRPLPDRSDVDAFIAAADAVRDVFFPPR